MNTPTEVNGTAYLELGSHLNCSFRAKKPHVLGFPIPTQYNVTLALCCVLWFGVMCFCKSAMEQSFCSRVSLLSSFADVSNILFACLQLFFPKGSSKLKIIAREHRLAPSCRSTALTVVTGLSSMCNAPWFLCSEVQSIKLALFPAFHNFSKQWTIWLMVLRTVRSAM